MKNRPNALVTDCTFTQNVCNVKFDNNSVSGGLGGAICAHASTLTVSGGSFSGNTADRNGGAIYGLNANVTVTDTCSITGNVAGKVDGFAGFGGGICVSINENQTASLTLGSDTTVSGNTVLPKSDAEQGSGADIYTTSKVVVNDNRPSEGDNGTTGEPENDDSTTGSDSESGTGEGESTNGTN